MSLDWVELKINQAEIDRLFEPNIVCSWAIALGRSLILRQSQYWKPFLLTESSLLFLSLLFFFPINLIICRKLGWLDSNTTGLVAVSIATVSLSFLTLIVLNYYLWQKIKKLKLLTKLLGKVDRYNQLINNFKVLSNIKFLSNTDNDRNSPSISELKIALNLTKSSLLKSIEIESFVYQQSKGHYPSASFYSRDRLLANLEDDLANTFLPEISSASEYQDLLNEAVDLGLSVHQEIRKIRLKELD